MKLIVLGTGPFAVPTCARLLADGHEIPLVVTRPVTEGKSKKAAPRPVYDWAVQHKLEVFEPDSINEDSAIARLAAHQPDLLFVCDYGQILSSDCLAAARLGGINLHGSLLPRHRGAAPVQWALLRGDRESGVTIIHMTPRLDAGPALAVAQTDILADETAEALEPRLAQMGVEATLSAIELLERWNGSDPIGQLQDKALVTRAPKLTKAAGQLDCRLPAEYLVRLVRACHPWPGTFFQLTWESGKSIRLLVRAARSSDDLGPLIAKPIGTVASLDASNIGYDWPAPWNKLLAVKTADGLFLISRVQPAGKREMDANEFLRGHPVDSGACVELPEERLPQLA